MGTRGGATTQVAGALAAQPPHRTEDLECLLLSFEECRRVSTQAAQCVPPLGRPRGSMAVQAVGGRIEEDGLTIDLLDHSSPGEQLFQGVARQQAAMAKLEIPELAQRVVLVAPDHAAPVFRAEVAQEEHQHQGVRLVATSLQEARDRDIRALDVTDVAEVLPFEETPRAIAGNPRLVTAPGAPRGQLLELRMKPVEALGRQSVNA